MSEADNQPQSIPSPVLIILGGLPGTGKTAIARELARQLKAVYLRIDSIEQEIRNSGLVTGPINDAGYRVAYALAEDNLSLGQVVIADSVNPIQITRDAWLSVAHRAHAKALEVEVICSDARQHRHRVETRVSDIRGLNPPSWQEILGRQYDPWNRPHIVIDTATRTASEGASHVVEVLSGL
jgi:predicted kinase